MRKPSVVTIANEQVSIITACQLVGMDLPDDLAHTRSLKVCCPFGEIYHSNPTDPAFRVYPDTNSAYCFGGCGYFTPVWLVAHAFGLDAHSAAVELLERVGLKPASLADAWAAASCRAAQPDRALLAEALKTYCARVHTDWATAQFQPGVADTLTRCLDLLDCVHTDDDARTWLQGCKTVMRRARIGK